MAEKMGKYSITMPRSLAEAAREVSGDAGLSAYIAGAVGRAVRHDRLGMFLAEYEELHGKISEERIAAAEAAIIRADEEHAERVHNSAAHRAGGAA
ncbi:CopG family transcriptional regulator [Promicromonospora sp. Populi]|uniref:CopG family transcriptional regulator n=1 Tax=Promicromonospora sp. Populi TaxID=3239420 RepID=UPI0034E2EE11